MRLVILVLKISTVFFLPSYSTSANWHTHDSTGHTVNVLRYIVLSGKEIKMIEKVGLKTRCINADPR